MLSKKEKIIMQYIFDKCSGKESVLISPDELANLLKPKYDLTNPEIKVLVDNLVLDGLITMILSDKKGNPIYCISLDKKGESYERDRKNEKQTLIKLIIRICACTEISCIYFILGEDNEKDTDRTAYGGDLRSVLDRFRFGNECRRYRRGGL